MDLKPLGLLAELTHRCPLACLYCSNPAQLVWRREERPSAFWQHLLKEAADLGVVEVHLSGGEPLLYRGLEDIISTARSLDLYVNLVTSGWGLDIRRASVLASRGVEHVQLSFQASDPEVADAIAGAPGAHRRKLVAARAVVEAGMALTINVVLHAGNLRLVEDAVALAEELGAHRLELAHTQWYGWALANRGSLAPTTRDVVEAEETIRRLSPSLVGKMELSYVAPDVLRGQPKACTGGWGRVQLTVAPDGVVLPCAGARVLPDLEFERAGDRPLGWIWAQSPSFNRFRGTDWMIDPCRSCSFKEEDYGGCRCQAFQLAGDPTVADPACRWSPAHTEAVARIAPAQVAMSRLPIRRRVGSDDRPRTERISRRVGMNSAPSDECQGSIRKTEPLAVLLSEEEP